jgi:uncharacterized membrane protein YhaH (DUF805 family)
MKNKRSFWVQMIFIIVIGLGVSIFTNDFQLSGMSVTMEGMELETTLENISLVLAFLALAMLAIFLIFRTTILEKGPLSQKKWKANEFWEGDTEDVNRKSYGNGGD